MIGIAVSPPGGRKSLEVNASHQGCVMRVGVSRERPTAKVPGGHPAQRNVNVPTAATAGRRPAAPAETCALPSSVSTATRR